MYMTTIVPNRLVMVSDTKAPSDLLSEMLHSETGPFDAFVDAWMAFHKAKVPDGTDETIKVPLKMGDMIEFITPHVPATEEQRSSLTDAAPFTGPGGDATILMIVNREFKAAIMSDYSNVFIV